MKFSSAVLLTASAGSAMSAALYSNGTSTHTDIQTTVVTITSCSDNKCSEIPQTTGLTTVTENETVYTTYCPLPSTQAPAPAPSKDHEHEHGTKTETDIKHTVITITSCADNKCTEVPQTTGVTTVTENNTVYTTYCPLPSTEAPAPGPAPTKEAPAPAPSKEAPAPAPAPSKEAPAPAPAPSKEAPAPAPSKEAPAPAPAPMYVRFVHIVFRVSNKLTR
ncbi:uncharacterized protein CANTADRAFT_165050 [Suhomyces tanzawaensis NRRL Y-17324]|uniref:Cell wall protein n=1 Tax=Suhomyces tanzawaensis NRRL Y-17324 TaxID=984487 RepID=A0A1E4SML5_9ASCO|nr:uncharacterized protein CANTADRAFT_165050 [Suhomyces tanzawaensis NRRL Y-17324]ODV80622.1 hypothetical protein CANTADRAFT_165050 [Suhomyces tanzawaensis NRRL Y-17324]